MSLESRERAIIAQHQIVDAHIAAFAALQRLKHIGDKRNSLHLENACTQLEMAWEGLRKCLELHQTENPHGD